MSLALVVPIAGIVAVIFALYMAWDVLRRDPGTPRMQEIGGIILEGAKAFLKRQYRTIGLLSLLTAVVIGILIGFFENDAGLGLRTAIAFMAGAIASGVSGFIGMYIAVRSNLRCASAAQRGLREAIDVALRGGAVSGFLIVALSLLGVTGIFFAYGGGAAPEKAPFLIVGFGFGASFVALFAQLGGGIYTKAADMGADLVGKIEIGIPEDDPRNAAVIADLVGDNVGDCAGRGADLFESMAAESIGAMIIGVLIFSATNNAAWIIFPLVVGALGLIASMLGILAVRHRGDEDPMKALNRGFFTALLLSLGGMFFASQVMLGNLWLFAAGAVGIATGMVVVFATRYYTESHHRPVNEIAQASRTGPATNIVMGLAVGFETTLATAVIIGVSLLLSYWLGSHVQFTLPGGAEITGGVFGTAVATMGMLMTSPYILSMDTFGPITDNANGIITMAGAGKETRKVTDRLDAVGNTTKALTKGYAMVSAGLAAFILFQAYMDHVALLTGRRGMIVNIARPEVFVGALVAVMLVFLFSSLAIRAVGKAAASIIAEVRRQFHDDPGIMEGTSRPDYARAIDITTKAGLRQMIAPGFLVIGTPIVLGVVFNFIPGYDAAQAVGALLMVGTIAGIIMASFMNNGGGAWDNAKKLIESWEQVDEGIEARVGKGSPTHEAAVVGDMVGDPLKDTAGPSLHVLVKLLATVTLVMSPLFI